MVRLVTFSSEGKTRVGVELGNGGDIADVTATDPSIPSDMRSLLNGGDAVLAKVKAAASAGSNVVPRANAKLLAPISDPEKICCVGMNYRAHAEEQNMPIPKEPVLFSKFASAICNPGDDILLPSIVKKLDFEVEMVIVVGKEGKNIKEADALDYVVGYTVAHDVSARDWQLERNGGQWMAGKTFDTFCPIGPAIVTRDELGDAHKLGLRCRVNGETLQDSNTSDLIFKTEATIAWFSQFVTIKPGDLILTGTPEGVGCFRKPPIWLKPGDVVEVEVDGIGCISNTVKAAP